MIKVSYKFIIPTRYCRSLAWFVRAPYVALSAPESAT
eukprot:COSAG02_NODE_332_length_24474_cov_23.190949_6_plen_37_part_00